MSLFKEKLELDIQEAELFTQRNLSQFPPVLVWLIFIALLCVIPAYYISKNLSEKSWEKKYAEQQIIAKPSFTNPQDPQISKVTLTVSGTLGIAAVVTVTNQNLDLSLDNVPYIFTFYNAQKQQINQYQGTLFLLPNQTKYITAPSFSPTEQIAYANFNLPQNLPWQKRLSVPNVNLLTSIPQTFEQSSPLAFVAQGDFFNNSPYTLGSVRLTFVLFDQNQNIIGVSQRDESTVTPFERRAYKQLWPNMAAPNLSRIDVTADTDTLDPNNLSAPAVNSNSASDLSRPSTK
jgi:hypothetical protein